MPSLFEGRSAINPHRSRGVAVAPVPTKPRAPQQTSAAIVPAAREEAEQQPGSAAWDGEPDLIRDRRPSPPATPPSNELAARDASSSDEDESKEEEERRGLAQVVPWQAVKYAATDFAGKVPRSRIAWKHTPESCRMCCICCSCLGCLAGMVVLFGFWTLIDKDECSSETHTCDPNADCTNLDGTYDCNCRDGYKGNGWNCEDIDECLDPERLGCDVNAQCANYDGSFACLCNEGYAGSGVVCRDIDECLEDNGGCGPALYHLCVNRDSDHLCTDVLECQQDNGGCGEPHLALCTENLGAPPDCSDIDECATDNGGCGDGFICLNYDGLQGLERECEDRDECVGSVSIAWKVSVQPELAADEPRATASAAVADPVSVGLDAEATRVDIGSRWAIGVPAGPLQSFAWVRQPAQCPTACGQAAVELPDTYKCLRDGLQVPERFCLTNLGDIPESVVPCPPTNDCNCIGAWSECPSSCGDKTFTVTTPKSGVIGNGIACDAEDGDTMPCVSGEGECFPYQNVTHDVDCQGHYPTCAADCERSVYNITRLRSGIGRVCPYPGTSKPCFPGTGYCPANIDCIGAWTDCDWSCSRTFVVTTPQSGTGQHCEAADGDVQPCPAFTLTCTGTAEDEIVYPDCEQAYAEALAGAAGAQDCPVGCDLQSHPVLCDDMDAATMDDTCVLVCEDGSRNCRTTDDAAATGSVICRGTVTLGASLVYGIKVDPATLQPEESNALARRFQGNVRTVLVESGLEESQMSAVSVVSMTTAGTHDCHEGYATCTNSIGSYSCACKDGFEGTGQYCRDIDECSINRGGCDARHARSYQEGIVETCEPEEGDAVTECARVFDITGTCPAECVYTATGFSHVESVFNNSIIGYCANSQGSFHCDCVTGFVLNETDQATCHDVDECAVDNGGCGPPTYFNCTNKVGLDSECGAGYPACDAAAGSYKDCDGSCFNAALGPAKELLLGTPIATAWLGDGWCDNGAQQVNFNCSIWRFDDGDCLV